MRRGGHGGKRKLWAVDHALGVSLVHATTSTKAAAVVRTLLGTQAEPIRVHRNQAQGIAWARAMGAKILND